MKAQKLFLLFGIVSLTHLRADYADEMSDHDDSYAAVNQIITYNANTQYPPNNPYLSGENTQVNDSTIPNDSPKSHTGEPLKKRPLSHTGEPL
jgi:hypothetical protein